MQAAGFVVSASKWGAVYQNIYIYKEQSRLSQILLNNVYARNLK